MSRGYDLIDRYGPELEYDFHAFLGLDLTDWFSGRGAPAWGKLIRLSNQLPSHGRFKAAVLDDDEFAESVGLPDSDDQGREKAFGLVDYDPVVARLTDIGDLLIKLQATLVAVNSEKKQRAPKYMARPQTAFDRLEKRVSREKRDFLTSILTPDR